MVGVRLEIDSPIIDLKARKKKKKKKVLGLGKIPVRSFVRGFPLR